MLHKVLRVRRLQRDKLFPPLVTHMAEWCSVMSSAVNLSQYMALTVSRLCAVVTSDESLIKQIRVFVAYLKIFIIGGGINSSIIFLLCKTYRFLFLKRVLFIHETYPLSLQKAMF